MKSEGKSSCPGRECNRHEGFGKERAIFRDADTSDHLCNIKCNCKYCKGLRSDQDIQEDVEEVDEQEVDKEEENARASYDPSRVRSEW